MAKAWMFLLAAGVCEIVWAAGLKKYGFKVSAGGVFTVVVMLVSFVLLDRAMRHLPLGTAYAVWTGIGAVGAAAFGMIAMGEPKDLVRIACIGLIVTGIVGLKWFSPSVEDSPRRHGDTEACDDDGRRDADSGLKNRGFIFSLVTRGSLRAHRGAAVEARLRVSVSPW
jgi:quaternary ammonium compound-resistance protein SugE